MAPADDRTPAERMGYVVELATGRLPDGVSITSPVRAVSGGIWLIWVDGATEEQEPIDFTLRLRAMDEAGNAGDPVTVVVRDSGDSGGCRVAAGGLLGSWLPTFALALLALAMLRAVTIRLRRR